MSNDAISELTRLGLDVEVFGPTLNVRRGTGPLARSVNIDPAGLLAWLDGRTPATRRRDIASWANGVDTTLHEPRHSDARRWSFVEAAGSLYPTIEGPGFTRGVSDGTSGEAAWVLPLDGDELFIGWVMRLGRGIRPLTAAHVAEWGVTEDRIVSAGRSLLFHATRQHSWRPTDRVGVLELAAGDSHDAARLLVAADVFFTEVDQDWRFALPHPDVLLAVQTPQDWDMLAEEARRREHDAHYPLDARLWRIGPRGPQLAER